MPTLLVHAAQRGRAGRPSCPGGTPPKLRIVAGSGKRRRGRSHDGPDRHRRTPPKPSERRSSMTSATEFGWVSLDGPRRARFVARRLKPRATSTKPCLRKVEAARDSRRQGFSPGCARHTPEIAPARGRRRPAGHNAPHGAPRWPTAASGRTEGEARSAEVAKRPSAEREPGGGPTPSRAPRAKGGRPNPDAPRFPRVTRHRRALRSGRIVALAMAYFDYTL